MAEQYTKPYLSYPQQLALMKHRGMTCLNDEAALRVLRAAGYYRLSAYVYPFRQMLEDQARRTSPAHFRAESLRPDTTFEQVEALWRFDRKLRLLCLDGLETIEVGIRTQVAHVLGRRDKYGHLRRASLDRIECKRPGPPSDGSAGKTGDAFDFWVHRYNKLQAQARSEDFVRHNIMKYGTDLPIWIAVEFLDFGAIVRLFGLLERSDQNSIARDLGITDGRLLVKWLAVLNYLRNTAAHHARLWNRTLTLKPAKINPNQVPPELAHAALLQRHDKVYLTLAILAALTSSIDATSNWPNRLRTLVRKFPIISGMSPELDMGFPGSWQDLALWTAQP
jgi:abortive infection bacteriophage resistance protein